MNTPSTFLRLIAWLLDQATMLILWLPVLIQGVGSWIAQREVTVEWRWIILCFLLQFAYKVFFIQFMGGTPGKLALGLRIVPQDPAKSELLWVQTFLRVMCDHLSIFFGYGLFALAFFRFDRTHLSDWVAETRVVQRLPRASPAKRRPFVAIFFLLYFSLSGLSSAYQLLQHASWDRNAVTIFIHLVE